MLECLEKLCQKMTNSEHSLVYIRKVVIAGIEKYDAKLKRSFLLAGRLQTTEPRNKLQLHGEMEEEGDGQRGVV